MAEFQNVDFELHTKQCINYFEHFVASSPKISARCSSYNLVVQGAVISLYKGCVFALKQTLIMMSSTITQEEHPFEANSLLGEEWTTIQELMLITSYCCNSAHRNSRGYEQRDNVQKSSSFDFLNRNKEPIYLKDVLLPLAPYWAVALSTYFAAYPYFLPLDKNDDNLNGQEGSQSDSSLTHSTRSPRKIEAQHFGLKEVVTLFSRSWFMDSVYLFLEDILRHLNISQSQHVESSNSHSLYARLKRVLKSKLKNPLFLAITLALSVHTSTVQYCFSIQNAVSGSRTKSTEKVDYFASDNLQTVELLLLKSIHAIIRACPLSGIQQDQPLMVTPLAIVAAHRITSFHQAPTQQKKTLKDQDKLDFFQILDAQFTLYMVQTLVKYAPSALTITDRSGLLPSHHAAKKGYAEEMLFLCAGGQLSLSQIYALHSQFFASTSVKFSLQNMANLSLTYRDHSGKTPFHQALLSWQHHTQSVQLFSDDTLEKQEQLKQCECPLILLARMYPLVLNPDDERGFKTLHFIQSHLPVELQHQFKRVWHDFDLQRQAHSNNITKQSMHDYINRFAYDPHRLDSYHYTASIFLLPEQRQQIRSDSLVDLELINMEQETSRMNAILLRDRRQRELQSTLTALAARTTLENVGESSSNRKRKRNEAAIPDAVGESSLVDDGYDAANQATTAKKGKQNTTATSRSRKISKQTSVSITPKLSSLDGSQPFTTISAEAEEGSTVVKRKRGRPPSSAKNIVMAADSLLQLLSSRTDESLDQDNNAEVISQHD